MDRAVRRGCAGGYGMFPGTMRFAFFNKGFTIPESYRDPGVLFLLRGKARVSIGNDKAELGVSDYMTMLHWIPE
jgi:hypothetical protein